MIRTLNKIGLCDLRITGFPYLAEVQNNFKDATGPISLNASTRQSIVWDMDQDEFPQTQALFRGRWRVKQGRTDGRRHVQTAERTLFLTNLKQIKPIKRTTISILAQDASTKSSTFNDPALFRSIFKNVQGLDLVFSPSNSQTFKDPWEPWEHQISRIYLAIDYIWNNKPISLRIL